MKIEKTDMEFVTFDAQDVIMTSNGSGSMGLGGYYWVSKSGVDIFNQSTSYYLVEPTSGRNHTPVEYLYGTVVVGTPIYINEEGGYYQWSVTNPIQTELGEAERSYLITDDEISNNFDDVISWLSGTAVRGN